ncbi:polysaccharide chain length determinant protein, PEP-CTERM locus subfamily [Nitrosomonas cryotolerans]|uniref:Polysaccharide chain length determinant protein, PEP-CTERM locus subfamily n=1 Tax=Nitrosomonas cryotolerans ATCC 49181 TaxID=1131553 RepID=A0A1N6J7J4_9PROT|nr:XrtA system polysaccharide chain length determinant [Nitrosomonas cryotolerans]SFP44819.1 polysaccharide chain length determinant protein, PEP-CTERM locus subfamily [Nitrosomonas cryotolerans]SIO40314.1 polysaccharide chain length determinant protein, PEP-CTERM locus subfamily [Nitrosomonas cryotolerans ATCC 49181]
MEELITQLYVYLKGIWKYRWVSMIIAWIIAITGWVTVINLPDSYQSSARIYVDTQNILRPLMAGMTVSPNLQQQISIISRTLISRPNVERIIRMVDLDIKIVKEAEKERLVAELMKEIKLGAATGGDNIFTISYDNKDPFLAKDIVQSLLTIFVEEGLDGKKDDSSSALRFIDQQIAAYEERLVTAENALANFKQRNIGLLPGQGGDYYSQLSMATDELKKAHLALKEAEKARDAIRKQISGDEPVLMLDPSSLAPESIVNPELDARIRVLKENLDTLRLNYTELHPDIISTNRLISQLEEQKREALRLALPGNDFGKNYSPMLQQLNVALTDAEAIVASMNARVEEYTARYSQLKSMSKAIPEVEAEFTQLNRDYHVNKANYEKLLERRVSAEMSGELTSNSGLLSFKIIDPPKVPEIPTGPDRTKLFTFVFLGALLVGVGVAFIISQIRPAFHSSNDLREVTGITVLGAIPMVWTDQQKLKSRNRLYIFGFSLLFLSILYMVLILYVKQIIQLVAKLPF